MEDIEIDEAFDEISSYIKYLIGYCNTYGYIEFENELKLITTKLNIVEQAIKEEVEK
jgi:hypothetical protein